jgi:hypothetical protein
MWEKRCCARGTRAFEQLIGIRLWRHQFADMGVVLAYEVARYLRQLGHAAILNDAGDWQEIERGRWGTAL